MLNYFSVLIESLFVFKKDAKNHYNFCFYKNNYTNTKYCNNLNTGKEL